MLRIVKLERVQEFPENERLIPHFWIPPVPLQ